MSSLVASVVGPTAAAAIGGAVVTGVIASKASRSAAETQANAGMQASADTLAATRETNAMQQKMYEENVARQQPWVTQGQAAGTQLNTLMGLSGEPTAAGYGSLAKGFTPADLALDPSYQFRLQQGQQALQASAAARGGLLTGQGAKDISNFGQEAASQEYQNAFNRYNTTQSNLYNRLAAISGTGQAGAAGVASQGTQVAGQIGQTTMAGQSAASGYSTSAAAAQAAGQIGSANAWANQIGGGINNYLTLSQLSKMGSATGGVNTMTDPNAYTGGTAYTPISTYG